MDSAFVDPFWLSLSTKPKEIEEIGQHTAGSFQRNKFKEKEHNKIGPQKKFFVFQICEISNLDSLQTSLKNRLVIFLWPIYNPLKC